MNKNIKIFINYFFGPLVFAWLAFSIYKNIQQQPQLQVSWRQIQHSFQSVKIGYLLVAMLLIFVNWGIEAWKWKLSVAGIQSISFIQAFKAVLSGVTFSISMPNRIGEYLGRVLYLPEGSRLKTISVTLVGSFAQLLTTLLTGAVGLIILKSKLIALSSQMNLWYQFILYGLLGLIAVLALIYFNVAGTVALFRRWISHRKYLYLVESLHDFDTRLLLQVLLLSFLRYFVFVVQYILIFYLFDVNVGAAVIACVMSVIFLAMAVVPSISLVEVGVRGEISLMVMGMFSANSLGIGLTSVTVWFINLILPAIAGSLLMLNVKLFVRQREREKLPKVSKKQKVML